MTAPPMENFVAALRSHGIEPKGTKVRCPAHDDHNASASLREGDDGRVLFYCFAGCTFADVVAALGIEMKDMFPQKDRPLLDQPNVGTFVQSWAYTDEDAKPLFRVNKYRQADGSKTFRQQGWNGTKYTGTINGQRRVLFNLPEVLAAIANGDTIWIVEGEKDCDTLRWCWDAVATCNPGGADNGTGNKFTPEMADTLVGAREVIIVADNDKPGHRHARHVEKLLAGKVGQVFVARSELGKDLTDHIRAGGTEDDLVELDDVDDGDDAVRTTFADKIRAAILRGDDIHKLPPPTYLIDGVVPARALSTVYGPSGDGKSFIVLDMAMAIAGGTSWHGHATIEPGRVVYVAAEGANGQGARLDANKAHCGRHDASNLIWLPMPVNLTSTVEVAGLIEVLRDEQPVLVIFDTQARCTVGAEENSNKEMGVMVDFCEQIIAAVDCAVLLVHHSGGDISRGMRGATAEEGAMDAILAVQCNVDGVIKFTIDKMKNGPEDVKHSFQLSPVGNSVVPVEVGARPGAMPEDLALMLAILEEIDEGNGVAPGTWRRICGVPETTFHRRRRLLVGAKHCEQGGTQGQPRYSLTEQGRTALRNSGVPLPATGCQAAPGTPTATANTQRVGSVAPLPPTNGEKPRESDRLHEARAALTYAGESQRDAKALDDLRSEREEAAAVKTLTIEFNATVVDHEQETP